MLVCTDCWRWYRLLFKCQWRSYCKAYLHDYTCIFCGVCTCRSLTWYLPTSPRKNSMCYTILFWNPRCVFTTAYSTTSDSNILSGSVSIVNCAVWRTRLHFVFEVARDGVYIRIVQNYASVIAIFHGEGGVGSMSIGVVWFFWWKLIVNILFFCLIVAGERRSYVIQLGVCRSTQNWACQI